MKRGLLQRGELPGGQTRGDEKAFPAGEILLAVAPNHSKAAFRQQVDFHTGARPHGAARSHLQRQPAHLEFRHRRGITHLRRLWLRPQHRQRPDRRGQDFQQRPGILELVGQPHAHDVVGVGHHSTRLPCT